MLFTRGISLFVIARLGSVLSTPGTCSGSNSMTSFSGMSSWSIEKNLFLNLPLEEKRSQYKVKSFLMLQDIPTWNEQAEEWKDMELAESDVKIFEDSGVELDESLNKQISSKISIWRGDITQFEVDAIANAANSELRGGGGVDGAIHNRAGPDLLGECQSIPGGCPTGEARLTGGYKLPAKYVIHTVGPRNKCSKDLENCYKSSFALMRAEELKSLVFPCIGTGIYGFPNVDAAHIACAATRKYLEEDIKEYEGKTERIIFCTFDKKDFEIYKSVARLYFPLK